MMMAVTLTGGAKPDVKFKRLDTRNGLSNSQVNCILKDSKGFVWIGTKYGLNRYDGYRFRVFHSNTKDTTALIYDNVDNLYEDADGYIWVQQETRYCVYDPKTERFSQNLTPWLEKAGIPGNAEKVFIDHDKNLWVKVWGGDVHYYNPHTGFKTQFPLGKGQYGIVGNVGISSFATYGKSTVAVTNQGHLVCFNAEQKRVSWVSKHVAVATRAANKDYDIYIDSQGNYWTFGAGRCFIYVQKLKRWFDSLPDMLRSCGFTGLHDDVIVWDVLEDADGNVMVATDHNGLYLIDNNKREAAVAYSNMTDELRASFDKVFTQFDSMMSVETNEHRYEQQEMLLNSVESLMPQINDTLSAKAEGRREFIEPKIAEMHIVSLDQRLVDAATEYVEKNISNGDITVETMSEALNMSRVHLYKRLTAVTGMSPSEFIRDLRLRHAEHLILKSQLSVSEISYKVGFNNPRYFSKYFKEKYGVIPSQYKKNE